MFDLLHKCHIILLADTDTYKRLTRDPTLAQEKKMNALLLPLMPGAIPEWLYQRLRSSAGKVPLLYGLPKVHEAGIPPPANSVIRQLPHLRLIKALGLHPGSIGW